MLFFRSFEMFSRIFDVVLFHTIVIVVTMGFERVGGLCLGWGIYLFFTFISFSNYIFVEIIVCFISSQKVGCYYAGECSEIQSLMIASVMQYDTIR